MKKNLAIRLLTLALMLSLIFGTAALAESTVHVLDATADLPAMAQGEKADGDSEVFGEYFTVMYSAKNKIDGSNKTFDDGYTATQRLNFGGKTDPGKGMINTVRFATAGAAEVKLWWVSGGDGRQFALYNADGEITVKAEVESVKLRDVEILEIDTQEEKMYAILEEMERQRMTLLPQQDGGVAEETDGTEERED